MPRATRDLCPWFDATRVRAERRERWAPRAGSLQACLVAVILDAEQWREERETRATGCALREVQHTSMRASSDGITTCNGSQAASGQQASSATYWAGARGFIGRSDLTPPPCGCFVGRKASSVVRGPSAVELLRGALDCRWRKPRWRLAVDDVVADFSRRAF